MFNDESEAYKELWENTGPPEKQKKEIVVKKEWSFDQLRKIGRWIKERVKK